MGWKGFGCYKLMYLLALLPVLYYASELYSPTEIAQQELHEPCPQHYVSS
jgi:hypothetical protein